MPGGDRTGPAGMGPMTGRGAGFCAGHDLPGYAYPGPARGTERRFWFRRFPGGRLGWRRLFHLTGLPGWARFGRRPIYGPGPYPYYESEPDVPLTPEAELEALRSDSGYLEKVIKEINSRIAELEKRSREKK